MKLKATEEVYAMKILNKWEMLKRAEVSNTQLCHPGISTNNISMPAFECLWEVKKRKLGCLDEISI